MIKLLKDNTTNTFFTRCKVCRSELEYSYEDVEFESIPYLAIPAKKILCPACGKETVAELFTKEKYDDTPEDRFPFLPTTCEIPKPEEETLTKAEVNDDVHAEIDDTGKRQSIL